MKFFVRDLHYFLTRVIDKCDIMGDKDDSLFPELTEVFEEEDSFDIEMVGWFIEDENIRFLDEKLGDLNTHLFPS
jgi:hypothetical protein